MIARAGANQAKLVGVVRRCEGAVVSCAGEVLDLGGGEFGVDES